MSPVSAQTDDADESPIGTGSEGFEPFDTPASEQPIPAERVTNAATGHVESIPEAPIVDIQKMLADSPFEFEDPLQTLIQPVAAEHQTRSNDTAFGRSPFAINIPPRDRVDLNNKNQERSVELKVLGPEQAGKLAELGTIFTLTVDGYGNSRGQLPNQASNDRQRGRSAPNEVDLGEASGWEITVDRSAYAEVLSKEQLDRLTVSIHGDCDKARNCQINRVLPTRVDQDTNLLIVELGSEVLKSIGGPDRVATVGATIAIPGGRAFRAVIPNMAGFAAQDTSAFFSVSTVNSGHQTDYSATQLASLATWQVGLSTGHAETSYSVPITPAVGPVPSVNFSYSSGSVDGMTPDKNNQGGNIGVGWSSGQPVITRATRVCATKAEGQDGWNGVDGNGRWKSNLCFAEGENHNSSFTLSMNGVGGRLIPYGSAGITHPRISTATYQRFVTETMNDLRIWLVTDTSMPTSDASNGGRFGQWWEVTTSDGTLYVFGRNYIFKPISNPVGTDAPLSINRVADTTLPTNSTQVVPLGKSATTGCAGERGMCDTVIAWHLDQTIDANGNMATYQYWKETNKYAQNVWLDNPSRFESTDVSYDSYINPGHIDYGLTYTTSSALKAPNSQYAAANTYRVTFDYSFRNAAGSPSATVWPDTPIDLVCSSSCTKNTPSMFTALHLTRVTVRAGTALVSYDVLHKTWPVATDASVDKMWLTSIQHHGSSDLAAPPIEFTPVWLANRVNTANGTLPAMLIPRIQDVKTELGGQVTFAYGQPGGREPSDTVASTHDCYTGANDPNGYVRTGCYFFQRFYSNATSTGPIFFNKYVVTSLTESSGISSLTDDVTKTFTYDTEPDWAYAEQWGFTKTDYNPGVDQEKRHCEFGYGCNLWSDYRGHAQVTVTDADGVKTRHYFHTGMRYDRSWTSEVAPLFSGTKAAANASVLTSLSPRGANMNNYPWQAGTTLGTKTILPTGDFEVRYDDVQHDWTAVTSATAWPSSHYVNSTIHKTKIYDPTDPSYSRGSEVRERFDSLTRLIRVEDLGLTESSASGSLTGDEVTTCIAHTPANASAMAGSWIIGLPYKTATVEGLNTVCGNSVSFPTSGSSWISGSVTRFDNSSVASTLPGRGNATATFMFEERGKALADWSGATISYNSRGQVWDTTQRHTSAVTKTRYDSWGLISSVDGPITGTGDKITFVNDERWGTQKTITTKNAQEDGNTNLLTTLTRDQFGRLTSVKLPGDTKPSTKYTYTLAHAAATPSYVKTEVLRDTNAASHEYIASYSVLDGFGRSIQTQTKDTVTGNYIVTSSYYGSVGQQKRSDNPVSVNNLTNPGAVYSPAAFTNGYVTTTLEPHLGKVTTRKYDISAVLKSTASVQTLGLTTTITDPLSNVTTTESDIRGNITRSVSPAHSGNATTLFTYNARNQVISINGPASNDTITYGYGANWSTRLKTMQDPDLGSIIYTHDNAGRLLTQQDGNGNKLWIGYSTASQPIQMRKGAGTGTLAATWVYDNTGRNTTATSYNLKPNGTSSGTVTTSATYDSVRGRLDATTWAIPGLGTPQTVTRVLDNEGRLDTIHYPDGSVSDVDYDLMGRQSTLTHDGTVLASGAAFNARGQLTQFSSGNFAQTGDANAVTTFSYINWSGMLRTKAANSTTAGGSTNLAAFTYEWDLNGNLSSTWDQSGGGSQYQCFDYDSANQLTNGYTSSGDCVSGAHETGPDPYEVTYTYEKDGNIASAYGTETVNDDYWYGGTGGVHAVNSAGVNSYSYSTGGNQIARNIDGANSALQYDIQNRLIGITGAGADMDALYDASGNRVKRTLDGEVTFYLGEGYEIQPSSISPLASATSGGGGTTTTTAPATTTTTTAATTTTTTGGTTTTTASGGSGGPLAILFLVNNPASLTSTEDRINTHLTLDGHTVTLRDAGASEETSPGDLIIIAHDGGLGNKYKTQAVPIISLAPGNWDNLELVDLIDGSNSNPLGSAAWTNQMNITDDSHPMAGGLTNGTFGFLVSSKGVNYAEAVHITGLSPALVAETTTAGQYTLLGYTSGQTMANSFTAPERRVLLSGLHNGNAEPTTDGWTVFDATVDWATGTTGGGGGTTTTTSPATTTTTAPATTTTTSGGGTTTTTSGGSSGPLAILFLVNNPASLTSTEDRINTHLTLDGHTVTLRDAGASEETSPGDLIIIAHDGGLGNKYKTQAVPIISLAPGNWDNLELVDLVDGSNSNPLGSAAWTNQMNITDDSHPMAGGLTNGTFGFLVSSKGVNYAEAVHITGLSPALVAETTTAGQYTLLGYTSGQTMANSFTAPERRVLLSGLHNGNAEPTTDGWTVFDAVVDWAASNTSGGGGGGTTTTTAPATTTTTAPATTTTTTGGTTTTTSGGGGAPVAEEIVRISHSFNGQMLGVSVNGEFTLTVTDHLGSSGTNREADGTTTVQKYTPFGALRTSTDNALLSDWTFTGQTDDPGTGLVDYNARHYDPELGRFVMADTVLDGLNRYAYVGNNPVNQIDPSGHCVDKIEITDTGGVEIFPTLGNPECDPSFGPKDDNSNVTPRKESFFLGQIVTTTIKNSDTTQMLLDAPERYKLVECGPGANWNFEPVSCFVPAAAAGNYGVCVGVVAMGVGGGQASVCGWHLKGFGDFYTVTVGVGAGVEYSVGVGIVFTNADEMSDLLGYFACVGGGAIALGGEWCAGASAWTLQPSLGLSKFTLGVHASSTYTWQIPLTDVTGYGVDVDALQ